MSTTTKHVSLSIMINDAIIRAKEENKMTFIRVYPDSGNVNIGHIIGDAAIEVQMLIENRVNFHLVNRHAKLGKPIADADLTIDEIKELINALVECLVCKSSSH